MPSTIELHSPVDSEQLRFAKPSVRGYFACQYRARHASAQQIAVGQSGYLCPPKKTSASLPLAVTSRGLRLRSVKSDRMRLSHVEFLEEIA